MIDAYQLHIIHARSHSVAECRQQHRPRSFQFQPIRVADHLLVGIALIHISVSPPGLERHLIGASPVVGQQNQAVHIARSALIYLYLRHAKQFVGIRAAVY